jgi:hypothetical protein
MFVGHREGGVRGGEDMPGGHDVQDGGAPDPGGVIEAHPVHDAGTAVDLPAPCCITQPAGHDRMLSTRASFDLTHRLPNTSLRIYPEAGHGGVFQHHEQFVPHVLELLR